MCRLGSRREEAGTMIDELKKHLEEVRAFQAETLEEIEAFRIRYLGKKGLLTSFFAELKNVPSEKSAERKRFGPNPIRRPHPTRRTA